MNFITLEHFAAVYTKKNISRASKALNITQQGLSRSIHMLEDELKATLFYRSNAGVAPTAFADSLYPHAVKLLAEYGCMLEDIERLLNENGSVIRVGTANATLPNVMPAKTEERKAGSA